MSEQEKRARFERLVLPHLDAAYSLATWLVRDDAQAEEAVQESYLRAFRFFDGLRGDDARPWLLGIVRNTCYSLLQRARQDSSAMSFDEDGCGEEAVAAGAVVSFPVNPEAAAIREADCERVRECLRALPAVCAVPIGTVMSRIARDESGQLFATTVRQFKERGVDFRVCNNTLVRRGIDGGGILPEATLVPSGIAEIGRLQDTEGYAYMRM